MTLARLQKIYRDYPRPFWMMIVVNFIDRLGFSLLFPFFALYVTHKFKVGMTEVGILFAVFSVSSLIGSFPGGALTDRFGRKGIIIFSLVSTSVSSLLLGFVNEFQLFLFVAFISGMFTDVGSPAYDAIFMDLLPVEKRTSGFGLRRVVYNLSMVVGPIIGGFIATRSYLALFILDAVISLIVAFLVFVLIPETRAAAAAEDQESVSDSFAGYGRILRDGPFIAFTMVSLLVWLVHMNLGTTLGVFLRDQRGLPESGYGWILSIHAALIVVAQFPITRRIEKYPPMLMMALGMAFLAVGFGMFGFVSTLWLFIVAMALLTVGEMIAIPVSNTVVAAFSPEDMRGRYNFVYGLSWAVAFAAGPYLAGLVLDNYDPNLLWYTCALLGALAIVGFLSLQRRAPTPPQQPRPDQ